MFRLLPFVLCVVLIHFSLASPARKGAAVTLGKKNDATDRVVCFYPNWAQYRPDAGKYTVKEINLFLCSHIVFAFADIDGTHLSPSEYNDLETYSELNALKDTNPSLTTLLSVGGASVESVVFEHVCSSLANMAQFASNVITYLREHGFDGLDVNWEFPNMEHRERFTILHKVLLTSFVAEGTATGTPRLILSSTLGNSPSLIYHTYDLATLQQHVDFVNVMTYDFHGYSGCELSTATGLHSALYGDDWYAMDAQNWTVSEYLSKGFPAAKLSLGIPTYGRSYTMCDPSRSGLGYPACSAGNPGQYTNSEGSLAYYEICLNNKNAGYTEVYSEHHEAAYSYSGDQWIGYDNVRSVTEKVRYALSKSLGGVSFFELSSDDFGDLCGSGSYPLIKAARDELFPSTQAPTTIPAWVQCEESGEEFIRDIRDCSVYYHCANGVPYRYQCPEGTVFDTFNEMCNWPEKVDCSLNPTPGPTTTTPKPRSTIRNSPPTPTSTVPPYIVCREDGDYIRDPFDCSVYYVCSNGEGHRQECPPGTVFDDEHFVCDFPENVDCSIRKQSP